MTEPLDSVSPDDVTFVSESILAPPARSKRRPLWTVVMVTGMLAAAGTVTSVVAARRLAHQDADKSRQALAFSSVEVASTLRLAIQREEDLAVSAMGFFLDNPAPSNADFVEWADAVQAMDRYPELLGWGDVVQVTPTELDAFAAKVARDPPQVTSGPFVLVPPGDRPFYCLFEVGQSRYPGTGGVSPGYDYCAGDAGKPILAAIDSGRSSYQAVDTGFGLTTLAVQVPYYRGGAIPETVEARRQAFLGWVGLGFDPNALLAGALRDHPQTGVTLRFQDQLSSAEFTSGSAPADAQSAPIDLGNGWTAETSAAVRDASVFSNPGALFMLFGGSGTSVLFAALVLVVVTGRKRAWQLVDQRTGQLRHQALHDALTGLPNRALITDRIEQLLARNRRHGTTGAALYIDIDDFKNVNDTLGHDAGDRLLVAVAARLTAALRDVDTIGRMGGDEFVVLIDDATLDVAPELVAQRLLNVMSQPFEIDQAAIPLSVNTSIGIAMGDRLTGMELLRDADVALYQAKSAGKNRFELFRPEMQTEIGRRIELEFELRTALDNDEFELVYQPIYNLDDVSLVAVEALLRWNSPKVGRIEPHEFIPILEQTGHIHEVGRWVLQQACAQMAEWHCRGETLSVSVNVSGRQLERDDITADVRNALEASGLQPGALIIEVAETALMHNAASTARRLASIKELGVQIAVDDFGTGYSSLAYLGQFPVDCLKIDRSFTHALTISPESKALINTLVQLGRDLGLRTLAEGVETSSEIEHLRHEHVDEAQGFLFSRPLDAATLEADILKPLRPRKSASAPRA